MKKMLRKKEEGAVLVFVALLMVVLLAFTALAIDFGTAYYQRQKLQTACDAAALAGVQYLPNTTKAKDVAEEYLKNNFSQDATVTVEFLDTNQKIRVSAEYKSDTTFGQILGSKNIGVTTHAAAGTKTITVAGGDFPYLLYSQEDGGTLNLGGKCHINGAVHSNGNVEYSAQNGEGEVSQISIGDKLTFRSGRIVIGSGTDKKIYELYKWEPTWGAGGSWNKVDIDEINNADIDALADIDQYYLLPEGPVKDSAGVEVIHSYGPDYTFTPSSISSNTFYKGSDEILIYRLSECPDILKKEKFLDWANDEPLKTITSLTNQCEARITSIKNGYDSATNSSTIAGFATSSDTNYLGSSHTATTPVVIELSSVPEINVGTTEQKNSTIVFKGNSAQRMQLKGTKSRVNNLIFISNTASSSDMNGLYFHTAVDMVMKNVYSNKALKLECNATTNKVVVNGNIYVNGDLSMRNIVVKGDIFATGNIDIECCDVNGFVGAEGDIVYKGMPSTMTSYDINTNPNALSVYSRSGNVNFIGANGTPPQTVVGVVLAMNGTATMEADFTFYGNIIGKNISNTAGSEWTAYPISQLPGYSSLGAGVIHVPVGSSTTETTYVLVE